MTVTIDDPLYGHFNIHEPVLLNLLNSQALHRLKSISCAGYYPAYPSINYDKNNRYHHSIGVFLLLRQHHAPLEEQIAGLLHDISHSAFSHTIDYIEENKETQKTHSAQDDHHNAFIQTTDIPDILQKHHISLDYILDDKNFPLKENDLPNICADRLDYSIRDGFVIYNVMKEDEKNIIIENLTTYHQQFVFKNFQSAQLYAKLFWQLDDEVWSGFRSAIMFALGGKFIRHAIHKHYIRKEDLFSKNDREIIQIIEENVSRDEELKYYLTLLNKPTEAFENNPEEAIEHVYCKVRKVDPLFLDGSRLSRVSDQDPIFKERLQKIKKFKEYYIGPKSYY